MSSGTKLPLSVVQPAALKLRDMLRPACQRIEFAGSLRRAGAGDPLIGDIELVAISNPTRLQFGVAASRQTSALESLLGEMIEQGAIRRWPVDLARAAWGDKYKKFWIKVGDTQVQVDLFLADVQNWGAIFAIRTGSQGFSRALVTHIRYKTPYVQEDGYLRRQADGVIVPVPEEEDYFRLAGVKWIAAVKRTWPGALVTLPSAEGQGADLGDGGQDKAQRQLRMF